MKHIKKINETFLHNWRKKDDLISSVWGITEDEIFDAISDVEDEWDVEIKCEFFLQSPKGKKFQLTNNDEKIEAYGAAGFLPIIGIYIETNQDIRLIQSTLMDSLKNLEDWFLYDVAKTKNSLKIYLAPEQTGEKIEKKKSSYHKRINSFFNEYFPELKKHGYRIIINKAFEKQGRFFIKHPEGPTFQVKKIYSIILEKVYNIDLKMIDDLAEVKQCLETCFQKLNEVEDFYDISYDFEIETSKTEEEKTIHVIFSIAVYEK
jgi:hypothetical protein